MSSDDNDTDDKDELFEDDDGIPSFDEEEPRTPQRKPKVSKLSKKKRLSNDQVQKVLDSSDEDTPVKKRCVARTPPIHYGQNCQILFPKITLNFSRIRCSCMIWFSNQVHFTSVINENMG